VGLTTLPCKKKIVEKPPRNSAGFCGGGHGLSWAVEPRKEEEEEERIRYGCCAFHRPSGLFPFRINFRYCEYF
jgi:hypothetical protein